MHPCRCSAVSKMKRGNDQVNPTPSEGKNRPALKNVTNLSNSGKLQPTNEKETRKIVTRSASTNSSIRTRPTRPISVAVNSENALKIRRGCNCLIPTKKPEEKTLFSHKTAVQNKGAVKKSTIAGQCTQKNSKPATFTGSTLVSSSALDEYKTAINKLRSRSTEVNYNYKFVPQCSSTLVHSEHDKNEILNSDLSTRLIPKNESTVFKSLSTFTSSAENENRNSELSSTLVPSLYDKNKSIALKSLEMLTPSVSGNKINFKPKIASTPKLNPVETVIINFYKKGYTNPYIRNENGEINIHPDFYKAYLARNMQLPHINFRPQYDKNHLFKNVAPILPNELTPLATIIHRPPSRDSLELSVKLKKKHSYEKRLKKYESQGYTLDIFSKEYDSEIIQYLLNTEDRYTLEETKLNGLNILDVRCEIISWLYEVKFYYVQETSIILKTIKLYDWVITHEIIPYNMHQLIVMTILMIVQKMDNSSTCDQIFTISQISSLCKRAFDSATINCMERKLLFLFNFNVNIPEPVTFLEYLCHNLQLEPIVLSTAELVLEIFSTNKMFSCISPSLATITALNLVLPVLATNFYEQSWSDALNTFTFISNSQMNFVGNIMREEIQNKCVFSRKNLKNSVLVMHQEITNLEIIKFICSMF